MESQQRHYDLCSGIKVPPASPVVRFTRLARDGKFGAMDQTSDFGSLVLVYDSEPLDAILTEEDGAGSDGVIPTPVLTFVTNESTDEGGMLGNLSTGDDDSARHISGDEEDCGEYSEEEDEGRSHGEVREDVGKASERVGSHPFVNTPKKKPIVPAVVSAEDGSVEMAIERTMVARKRKHSAVEVELVEERSTDTEAAAKKSKAKGKAKHVVEDEDIDMADPSVSSEEEFAVWEEEVKIGPPRRKVKTTREIMTKSRKKGTAGGKRVKVGRFDKVEVPQKHLKTTKEKSTLEIDLSGYVFDESTDVDSRADSSVSSEEEFAVWDD